MKKRIPIFLLALMLLACSISNIPTQPAVTEPPVVTNVTCNELAFYLDPALASGYSCETVAESPEGIEVYPQSTKLTLQGYVLADNFFTAFISVFPVQSYSDLLPDNIPGRVAALQALISGGSAPVFTASFSSALPFLPTFNAAQVFFAEYQTLPFVSGGGIRFLTEYAQYYAPVNNYDLFYTYQGLTSDGLNWVSAILPINNPILPANPDPLPGGVSFEDFSNNYEPYITDMVNKLNTQAPASYIPSLDMLDALVASITIQP